VTDKERIKELETENTKLLALVKFYRDYTNECGMKMVIANGHSGKLSRIIHRQRLTLKKYRERLNQYEPKEDRKKIADSA
jgi:hypothetical protein